MPTPPASDRITELEARLAELERHQAPAPTRRLARPRVIRRVAAVALALALVIPAGVVLASHRFNDVPTSHQFHAAISAIADAGITTGCPQGTNNYCPNGLVTRGQMAAFLSRLGALQAGSAPKVNADKVDGLQANQLVRAATISSTTAIDDFDTCAMTTVLSKSVTAPANGILMVWGTIEASKDFTDPDNALLEAQVAVGGAAATVANSAYLHFLGTGEATIAVSGAVPVTAGSKAVVLQAQECSAGMAYIVNRSITTLFVPFGDSGTQGSIAAGDLPQVTGSESTESVNGE